jgi:N-methylhydantoinase A
MVEDGFDRDQLQVKRYADMKYPGQVYELTIAMPDRITADDLDVLRSRFFELYEGTYGEGTAWTGAAPVMQSYTVAVSTGHHDPRTFGEVDAAARPQPGPTARRRVFLPETRQWQAIPVVPEASFAPGDTFEGPLIVDATDTTIYVPTGVVIGRHKLANYRLTVPQEGWS